MFGFASSTAIGLCSILRPHTRPTAEDGVAKWWRGWQSLPVSWMRP
jgi:hypothetical protein